MSALAGRVAGVESSGLPVTPMKITLKELTVDLAGHTPGDLLSEWRWLLDDSFQLVLISSLGDMFLTDEADRVHWLDAGVGRLTMIAGSMDEFQHLRFSTKNNCLELAPDGLVRSHVGWRGTPEWIVVGECQGHLVGFKWFSE